MTEQIRAIRTSSWGVYGARGVHVELVLGHGIAIGHGQVELLSRRRWRTRIELANAIFEYLEIIYNRQRRHSALGYLSPIQFENQSPVA